MIRKTGHGFTITHTLDEEVTRARDLAKATDEQATTILEAIGIQVLSWIWQDYRTKARGGTDPAGNKWKPITKAAIRSRLLKRQSYRSKVDQVRALQQQNQVTAGQAFWLQLGRQPAGVAESTSKRIQSLHKQKRDMVDAEHAKHEIGVDTGRLVNSLEVGRGYVSDTILDVDRKSVRVGSALKYAAHFNAKRPIIDEKNLTPARLAELDEIIEEVLQPEGTT